MRLAKTALTLRVEDLVALGGVLEWHDVAGDRSRPQLAVLHVQMSSMTSIRCTIPRTSLQAAAHVEAHVQCLSCCPAS